MFQGAAVAVSDTAVQLSAADGSTDFQEGQSLAILGCDVDIYLGGSDAVTASGGSRGARLTAGTPLSVDLAGHDHVWAICATGISGTAEVVRVGV